MIWAIQKIPSRNVDDITSVIPEAKIIEAEPGEPVMKTFRRSLMVAGQEALVRLEDDIELCTDFREKITEAINMYPYSFISFFTLKNIYETTMMNGKSFCMSQCTYYPPHMAANVVKYQDRNLWARRNSDPTAFDYMVADYMSELKQKYILWAPSLVQHKKVKSAINPRRSSHRQAKNFAG